MKLRHVPQGVVACALFVGFVQFACAQDAVAASPNVYKVLTENESARVIEGTYLPGETESWHAHPGYFQYIVDSGRIRVETEGREPRIYEVKSGQNLLSLHVGRHRSTNVETNPICLLIIEFRK